MGFLFIAPYTTSLTLNIHSGFDSPNERLWNEAEGRSCSHYETQWNGRRSIGSVVGNKKNLIGGTPLPRPSAHSFVCSIATGNEIRLSFFSKLDSRCLFA